MFTLPRAYPASGSPPREKRSALRRQPPQFAVARAATGAARTAACGRRGSHFSLALGWVFHRGSFARDREERHASDCPALQVRRLCFLGLPEGTLRESVGSSEERRAARSGDRARVGVSVLDRHAHAVERAPAAGRSARAQQHVHTSRPSRTVKASKGSPQVNKATYVRCPTPSRSASVISPVDTSGGSPASSESQRAKNDCTSSVGCAPAKMPAPLSVRPFPPSASIPASSSPHASKAMNEGNNATVRSMRPPT